MLFLIVLLSGSKNQIVENDGMINFFNNSSVGAFIGAFSAFLLVMLIDWIRRMQKKKLIARLIEINKDRAQYKIESVNMNQHQMTQNMELDPSPIMHFSIKDIRDIESQVLNQLKVPEKQALDSICYTMSKIDIILDGIIRKIEQTNEIKITKSEQDPLRIDLLTRINYDYNDARVNMKRLIDMSNMYIEGKYQEILDKKYKREDYE